MLRRFVAIIVTVGFSTSQWVALPRAHGAMPQGMEHSHSTTPHLHLSWFHEGTHAHGHSHGGHHHVHHDHQHSEPDQIPDSSLVNGEDHDTDALYLPTGTSSGATSTDRVGAASFKWQLTKALLEVFAISDLATADSGQVKSQRYAPDARAPNCALYLQLRTLRI